MDRLAPALADRYRVERELGAGGMATVYLAHDLRHERDVAIKVLHPDLGATLGSERFLAEIRTTATLQHPNLLPLFDSGEADGLLFYVMPFVEGETLRVRLDREKQLPLDEALRLTTALATALGYAHARGVIHRDIKPENILLPAAQPVIADFGIALAVRNAGGARITQTGLSLGTPQFMSPEQAMGDRVLDARTDQYSLAAILYEMLAGEPPHSGTTGQAVIAKLLTDVPRPLRSLRASVPGHVEAAVRRALEKLPADRWSSVDEFAAALRTPSAFGDMATASHPPVASRRWPTALLVAVALLASVAAVWGWRRPMPTTPTVRYAVALDSGERLGGSGTRLALSPDGSSLVYTNGLDRRLWIRRRDALRGVPIPGTEDAQSPFFSPDGTRIGYLTPSRGMRLIALDGAGLTAVTDSVVGLAGAVWSDAGMIYADAIGNRGLVQVEARPGATPRPFTTSDTAAGEVNHAWPEMLPDGGAVLFQIRYSINSARRHTIGIADVATGRHRVLCDGIYARVLRPGYLLIVGEAGELSVVPFDLEKRQLAGEPRSLGVSVRVQTSQGADVAVSRDGRVAYATGSGAAEWELARIDRDGRSAPFDTAWRDGFTSPRLSPDGEALAVLVGNSVTDQDVWIKRATAEPLRLTLDSRFIRSVTWGPDPFSVTVVGLNPAEQRFDVFVQRADGRSTRRVIALPNSHQASGVEWSPDGKWLVYETSAIDANGRQGNGDVYLFRPGIDSVATAVAATKAMEGAPAISPDGRLLAFTSGVTGRSEVYVVPFPNVGDARWPISTNGGGDPRWSRDGTRLLYLDGARRLQAAEVSPAGGFHVVRTAAWPGSVELGGTRANTRLYDPMTDGSILIVRPVERAQGARLVIVENWLDELRRSSSDAR
ncbi:MAG: serine/threonine-protein kinase [Gemmatimonadaceae bacterium]|nr:serine/threonine-protein kinase [Gemmatimonadaceae bacterium]